MIAWIEVRNVQGLPKHQINGIRMKLPTIEYNDLHLKESPLPEFVFLHFIPKTSSGCRLSRVCPEFAGFAWSPCPTC
jgi:hypothetical protein